MTPENLIVVALLAPLIGAVLSYFFQTRHTVSAACALVAASLGLFASIGLLQATADGSVHALAMGDWEAPFGIVMVADTFASLMMVICQLVVLASLIFSVKMLPVHYRRRSVYALTLTLSLGTTGAFLTGDLFNLYVWFEVLLLSSFALMAIVPGKTARAGTWRYVVINLVSSLLFLAAAGLIYGKTGTLNFADLHLRLQEAPKSFLLDSSTALLVGAFGIKSALIPLAFWLPSSYPSVPPALSAMFAGLLTKVGLYAFFRVFGMVFAIDEVLPHQTVLFVLALLTMLGGVLGAVGQNDMRRILSFHIISQVGYMALALAIYTPLAVAAGIYYLFHHIVVKANLFLVTALVENHAGSSHLDTVRGVARSSPIIALLFAVPALSLAGLPPLSGFFAKFSLLKAALADSDWLAALFVALVGILTIFSMLKIWRNLFWGEAQEEEAATSRKSTPLSLIVTSASLAVVTILIGVAAGPVFGMAQIAADSLMQPQPYLDAVLGPDYETPITP